MPLSLALLDRSINVPQKRSQRLRKSFSAGFYRAGQLVQRSKRSRVLYNEKSGQHIFWEDIGLGMVVGECQYNPNFVEVFWQKHGVRERIHKKFVSLHTTIVRKDDQVFIPCSNEQSKD